VRAWKLGAPIVAAIVLHLLFYRGFEVQTTPNYGDELAYRRVSTRPWSQILTYYQPLVPATLKGFHAAFGREWLVRFAQFQESLFVLAALLAGWLVVRATDRAWAGAAAMVAVLADVRLGTYQYWALTEILTLFLSLVACAALVVHAMRTRWPAAAVAALALALLVFLRSQNLFVLASFLTVAAVLARGGRDWLRRAAPMLAAGVVMLSWAGYKQYSGAQMYSQSGFSVYFVLMHHKGLLARLPADDADLAAFRRSFAAYAGEPPTNDLETLSASDLALPTSLGGIWSPEFNRAVRKAYTHLLLHHPLDVLGTAARSFWTEQVSLFLPPYPEDANVDQASSGIRLARRLNRGLYSPIANVATSVATFAGLLAALVHARRSRRRAPGAEANWTIEIVAVLGAWTVTDAVVTSLFFYPFWPPDASRMRLHYEAQAIAVAIIGLALLVERALRNRRSSKTSAAVPSA